MGEEMGYLPIPNFETLCVHHTDCVDRRSNGSLTTPVSFSSYYENTQKGKLEKYLPGRLGNPTRKVLESLLSKLSRAKYGLLFSSGMGSVMAALSLLKKGDRVLLNDDIYGGTTLLLLSILSKFGIKTTHMDFTNVYNVEAALKPDVKMLWTENPTNPKMQGLDLCALSKIAREQDIIMVTDNTVITPYLQRPLELGVDVALFSLSKYINGHADVIMGFVCTNRKDLYKKLKYVQTNYGHVPCPLDCYQVIRGIKTLPMRLKKHQSSSLQVAKFLETHPKVESVLHPGLSCHPQYELFKKQTSGHSGLFSFYLKGGLEDPFKFINGLQYFNYCGSFGGPGSTVLIPLLTTHPLIPEELKERNKYTANLIRVSIGLENACDLIKDLEQSLEKI